MYIVQLTEVIPPQLEYYNYYYYYYYFVQKIHEQHTRKTWSQGITENSQIGHYTHTLES